MAAAGAKGQGGAGQPSSNKLEDQAATAALYVTKGHSKSSHPLLDDGGKLSSAGTNFGITPVMAAGAYFGLGAATSLKYAKPQDLPSFPSSGLQIASAGAAASLADTNKKSVDLWKPGSIPTAEKAASLARDYEADPLWQPELSATGSKAALIASDRGANVKIWKARDSDDGHSAAEQAVRKKISPSIDHRAVPADASRKAMMAATGAMVSSRKRAGSAPTVPPKSSPGTASNAHWASKAATQSHRGQRSGLSNQGGDMPLDPSRIQNVAQSNVSRQMYTSHPPVSVEVEEKNRQDTIRASAVAMAQKMYAIQQKAIEEAKVDVGRADSRYAARNVHNRRTSDTASIAGNTEPMVSPLYGNNLQEAAQRLAQERLAKLRDEREEYKNYYGQKSPTARSRLSIHSKLRRRASSDGAVDDVDEEQSRKIRSQMSTFQSNLEAVDSKKRQKDRDALLLAAQKNVRASMHSMDESVFQETGKSSPAQREAWATKAKEKAQAESDVRMENYGKVHIGAGKYLDQGDVDAVAKSKIQPTLDDINEKAETQRAHEAEIKLEQEERKRQAELDKQRSAELKAEQKKIRDDEKREEKSKKAEEKRAHKEEAVLQKEKERAKKEDLKMKSKTEKEQLREQTRLEEEETRRSKDKGKGHPPPLAVDIEGAKAAAASDTERQTSPGGQIDTQHASSASSRSPKDSGDEERPNTAKSTEEGTNLPPASPSKGQSKVKSWLTERFRRSSRAAKDADDGEVRNSGFIGGASLTGAGSTAHADEDKPREESMRDVAMAGRPTVHEIVTYPRSETPVSPVNESQETKPIDNASISSLSESGEDDSGKDKKPPRGRLGFTGRLLGKSSSKQGDDTDGNEEFEEARDTAEGENLAPPPKLTAGSLASKASGSPVRDSKFSENL